MDSYGKNRYIQVCDVHAKLFAFRGGGKDGEYGLYVEDDFKRGRTIKDLVKHLKPHSFARTIGLKL